MKHVMLAALLAAFAAAPAAAQMHPMPQMSPAQMQQMRQMHEQLRTQVLGYLTPAHKALLAQVVGDLATTANPNYDAAASRLDAALSPAEKKNILGAASEMHTRMQAMSPNMPSPPPMTAGGILLMLAFGHGPGMMMMR